MKFFPILHSERLDLIEINESHLHDLFILFGDENVVKYYNLLPFENENQGKRLLELYQKRILEQTGIRWGIALKGTQNIIGTVGFNSYTENHRATIGYDLQYKYWNRGYIKEAIKVVVEYGFNQLKINRIEAEVMHENIVSEIVLQKLNFKKEGVLRDWMHWNEKYYDMSMFSLLKSDSYQNRY